MPSVPDGVAEGVGQTKPGRKEALLAGLDVVLLLSAFEQDAAAVSVVWVRMVMVALSDMHQLRGSAMRSNFCLH